MTFVAIPLFLFIAGMTGYQLVKLETRDGCETGLPRWLFRISYGGAFMASVAAAMILILERLGVTI